MPINGADAIVFLLVIESLGLDSKFVEKGGIEKDLSCSKRLMAFQKKKIRKSLTIRGIIYENMRL